MPRRAAIRAAVGARARAARYRPRIAGSLIRIRRGSARSSMGRAKVREVIGRGGMGVVYRVEHLRMGKIAAMKVLHRDLASEPDVIARFEREAAAISKLHHPHTVQVFDF